MARTTKKQTKKAGKARKAPKSVKAATVPRAAKGRKPDPRIPPVGTVMTRSFKGKEIKVEVLEAGFRWDGKDYGSLTAVALAVTGYPACSGTAFFGLWQAPAKRDATPAPKATRKAKTAPATDEAPEPAATA